MSNQDELVIVDWTNERLVGSGQDYPLTEGKARDRVNALNNPAQRNIYDPYHRVMTRQDYEIMKASK